MTLLGSTENKITKNKNGENVAHFDITEVALNGCNIVNNDYQQDLRLSYTFVPNKSFGSSLQISSKNNVFLKTFNSEFYEIEVWFTDQNSQPLEIEDKINLTLITKWYILFIVNRLFVLHFEDENGGTSHSEYYVPKGQIKD